ncbi:MAG: YbhN family protein [Corynebacterium sp.]|nr:YbhN family protein [Corynebacterium sp.]
MTKSAMKALRWAVPLAALVIIIYFVHSRIEFFTDGARYIRTANLNGVLATIGFSFLAFFAMARVMKLLLDSGGHKVNQWKTLGLTFTANSWSGSVPGGAVVAAAFSFQVMRSWGASALVCSWQIIVSSTLSTTWLVALGIIGVFFLDANFSLWALIGTLAISVLLSYAIYWAAQNPEKLIPLITWGTRTLNKIRRKDPDAGLATVVDEAMKLKSVKLTPATFIQTAIWSFLNWFFEILALYAAIRAVDMNHISIGATILAFVTAKILGTVQVTPGGLGPVETALTMALTTAGMSAGHAIGAVVIYRLISYGLMVLIGWLIYFFQFAMRGINARNFVAEDVQENAQ